MTLESKQSGAAIIVGGSAMTFDPFSLSMGLMDTCILELLAEPNLEAAKKKPNFDARLSRIGEETPVIGDQATSDGLVAKSWALSFSAQRGHMPWVKVASVCSRTYCSTVCQ